MTVTIDEQPFYGESKGPERERKLPGAYANSMENWTRQIAEAAQMIWAVVREVDADKFEAVVDDRLLVTITPVEGYRPDPGDTEVYEGTVTEDA